MRRLAVARFMIVAATGVIALLLATTSVNPGPTAAKPAGALVDVAVSNVAVTAPATALAGVSFDVNVSGDVSLISGGSAAAEVEVSLSAPADCALSPPGGQLVGVNLPPSPQPVGETWDVNCSEPTGAHAFTGTLSVSVVGDTDPDHGNNVGSGGATTVVGVDEAVTSVEVIDLRTGLPTTTVVMLEGETVAIAFDFTTVDVSRFLFAKVNKVEAIERVQPGVRKWCRLGQGGLPHPGNGKVELQDGTKVHPHDVPAGQIPKQACSVGFKVISPGVPQCPATVAEDHDVQQETPQGDHVLYCKHWLGHSNTAKRMKGSQNCNVTENEADGQPARVYDTTAGKTCYWDTVSKHVKTKSGGTPEKNRTPTTENTALPGSAGVHTVEGAIVLELEGMVDINPANDWLAFTYELVICPDEDADGFPDPGASAIDPDCELIGGTTELLVGGSDAPASAADGSGSSFPYAAIAGGLTAAVLALGAGGWYARRRWVR